MNKVGQRKSIQLYRVSSTFFVAGAKFIFGEGSSGGILRT